ncbi:hypothetical protein [Ulvibacterium marinum]|uniref:Right-handed parallel beta-helix repeat-containing protein n=1 Tax=Ulvibacterium marinum TaxID=2419782 RepID=A0A3B0CF24_9FLAO|nr:hypothetical protein [Ulvibacterium marinum]RKN83264.1 hypothetical protein D7Z94_05385 [Ulvibacterium marinum]
MFPVKIYIGSSLPKSVFVGVFFFLIISCSDDDPVDDNEAVLTCFDGILNGDEITVDCGGVCPGFCPLSSIGILGGEVKGRSQNGELVDVLQLDPSIEYRLVGPLLIRDKGALSIPAGTVIKADPNVGAYIAVAQGGQLFVFGQPENPAVITSGAENPMPGDWGGVIICGQAPIDTGEVGRSDIIDIFYGGSELEDSSGFLNYLRIEYAGAITENQQNFDGIAFYGVGAFTNVTNVQTYESLGNGIRFIGGNADAERLVVTNAGANGIAVTNDWSGNGNSWYLSGVSEAGIRISSNELVESPNPIVTDTIRNISMVGPNFEEGLNYSELGGSYVLTNVHTTGMQLGINVEGPAASNQIDLGNLQIDSIQFDNPATDFVPTNYTGTNPGFYQENIATGAGNEALKPDWANGWTRGLQ